MLNLRLIPQGQARVEKRFGKRGSCKNIFIVLNASFMPRRDIHHAQRLYGNTLDSVSERTADDATTGDPEKARMDVGAGIAKSQISCRGIQKATCRGCRRRERPTLDRPVDRSAIRTKLEKYILTLG